MINYAHRGASEYAPENTMASFCMGLEMGANGIETDVQRTRDGELVLHHDATLLRTAGVDARVCDLDWRDASQLDMGSFKHARYCGERLVRLEDFLYYFGGKPLWFAIEIKQAGIEREALDMVRRCVPMQRVTFTSFMLEESLKTFCGFSDKPRLGYLTRDFSPALLDELRQLGIEEYCPRADLLTPEIVQEVRARGMGLRAWGVKTDELMRYAATLDVDGMTVNFPDKLTALLR